MSKHESKSKSKKCGILAFFQSLFVRKRTELEQQNAAAIVVQRAWRNKLARKEEMKTRHAKRLTMDAEQKQENAKASDGNDLISIVTDPFSIVTKAFGGDSSSVNIVV